ncbi:MAG: hypothetical protein J1F35_03745 [Erysipelotrichales bacterium]|nr:hypothetical protein [Erysipelotrichales bacterium]
MCKKEDLYCYVEKNGKMNLGKENKKKDFKEKYKSFLCYLWESINVDGPQKYCKDSDQGPYVDPDSKDGKRRINPNFYTDLCAFLNFKEGSEKYTYTKEDEFIHSENGVQLVSDQCGFSAPGTKLSHPYDVYLIKCKKEGRKKDESIDKVVNWVMESRTIGGSFLWTKEIWAIYNIVRGGSSKYGNYIEDRVDLTLCEIKHYLNKENFENDILYKKIKNELTKEEIWLKDFKSFDEYVDYFCFNTFVDKNYMPYDIVNSNFANGDKILIDESEDNYKKRKKVSIFDLTADQLETMLNNVNFMIKKRSKLMMKKMGTKK